MKTKKGKLTICTRGHSFYKSSDRPVCPKCWPGRYKVSRKKKYTHYHKDGTMWAKGYTLKGKMEGYWEWFRKNGIKMRAGNFKKGKQVGKWTTYDSKGQVRKVTDFGT